MNAHTVSVAEAADLLGLSVSGVEALADAGYLRIETGALVPMAELKSFQARNAAAGTETVAELLRDLGGADAGADEILRALDAAVPEMARRAADIVGGLFSESHEWARHDRTAFEQAAVRRFQAILTVTRAPVAADDLLDDLAEAGGAAAFAGAPLPQVLLTLRVSRDLLVQTAVSAAEELGREWSLALAVVLTRVLPVLDKLTDTVARGYWSAVGVREQEAFARFEHVVEHTANGIYEVDVEGRLRYANPRMRTICGAGVEQLLDRDLATLLPPVVAEDLDVFRTPTDAGWRPVRVLRGDGVERDLLLQITERTVEGVLVGFDGVVRDVSAEVALEAQKRAFVELVADEVRQPLHTIIGLGATLEAHADELPRARMERMGRSIHIQAERIARLTDDLRDVSHIGADDLSVVVREVHLASSCAAALRMLGDAEDDAGDDVRVEVDDAVRVMADARRLEQVIAHLIENARRHGAPPVQVCARPAGESICLEVLDHGTGIAEADRDGLFATLRPTALDDRRRDRASGLGLPLARALVEAMGGRLSYAPGEGGGALFRVHLPVAPASRATRAGGGRGVTGR